MAIAAGCGQLDRVPAGEPELENLAALVVDQEVAAAVLKVPVVLNALGQVQLAREAGQAFEKNPAQQGIFLSLEDPGVERDDPAVAGGIEPGSGRQHDHGLVGVDG